jgi:hypothetical protein
VVSRIIDLQMSRFALETKIMAFSFQEPGRDSVLDILVMSLVNFSASKSSNSFWENEELPTEVYSSTHFPPLSILTHLSLLGEKTLHPPLQKVSLFLSN